MATPEEILTHLETNKNTFNNIVKSEGNLPLGVDNLETLEANYARGAGSLWNVNNTYQDGDIVSGDDLEIYVSKQVLDEDGNPIVNTGFALTTEHWEKIESMKTTPKKGFLAPIATCNFVINFGNSDAPTLVNKTEKVLTIVRTNQFNIFVNLEEFNDLNYSVFAQVYENSGTNSRNLFVAINDKVSNGFNVNISGNSDSETSLSGDFKINLVIIKGD